MPVRSARVAQGNSNPVNTEVTLLTCPALKTIIIKDIRVSTATGTPTRGVVFLVSGAGRVSLVDRAWGALDTFELTGFMVLEPGDQLRIYAQTGSLNLWASGAELDGVA